MATSFNPNLDSLHQLFRKLAAAYSSNKSDAESFKYIFLIQYSLSKQLRLAAAAATDAPKRSRNDPATSSSSSNKTLYLRAGLRTPEENALRDLQGAALWIQYTTQILCREFECVIWLQTLATRRRTASWIASIPNLHVVDAAIDPFGWDRKSNEEEDCEISLNDLDHLLTSIQQTASTLNIPPPSTPNSQVPNRSSPRRVPLVIQSLTPIYQRHGIRRTMRFLEALCSSSSSSPCCFYPVIVPILTESVAVPQHHQKLEDLAHALLYIHAGEAILLRQGVREKANLVRESLAFEITRNAMHHPKDHSMTSSWSSRTGTTTTSIPTGGEDRYRIQMLSPPSVKESSNSSSKATVNLRGTSEPSSRETPSENMNTKGKVQLALANDDDDAPRNPAYIGAASIKQQPSQQDQEAKSSKVSQQQPLIYVQDDDPEFDDYDEEDPDDDLDI